MASPNRNREQRKLSTGMKRMLTGSRTLLEAALEREGITLAQLRMLNALHEHAQTSAAGLARLCYVTPQSMQAAVIRAEREGWIEREASPANRRILTAKLTRRGRQVLKRGLALWSSIEQEVWSGASPQELRALNDALLGALERLQEMLDRNHAGQRLALQNNVSRKRKSSIS